ncbi:hypothetical protein Q1695_001472 [Nippostrongylus brasiliensis]|nr:hypothetical protein Q1695_001472 [Nippostrongylus brasiliensis]
MKNPLSDSLDSTQDPSSIWSSYRRAALRISGQSENLNIDRVREPEMRSHRRVASGAEEDGVNVERLQAEVRRLKRLVQDKDLVIDTLMERLVKLRRSRERDHNSSSSSVQDISLGMTRINISGEGASMFREQKSSSSSSTDVATEEQLTSSTVVSPKGSVRSQTFIIRKGSKVVIHRKKNSSSQSIRRSTAPDFNPMNTSTSSHAFVVPKPFGDLDVNKNRKSSSTSRSVMRSRPGAIRDEQNNANVGSTNHNVFVIESLSPRSQRNHPDWKDPLPPSVCLQSKRPEIIRRIENRQAAISAATALRHRVSEEKRIAARAVVLGKCPFSKVRNNLFRDPTVITAFPKHEIINLTKRRLRESSAYRSEKSGEKNRIDIAASKIIAQSFSEATRQAVLAGRTSFNQ